MSAPTFSVKSSISDRELVFREYQPPDYFVAELVGSGVRASRRVYAYTDGTQLSALFSRLAACERPWIGIEEWASLESELSIEAQSTPLGRVVFTVEMHDAFGADEEWEVSATIVTELGQLPAIADLAARFFAPRS